MCSHESASNGCTWPDLAKHVGANSSPFGRSVLNPERQIAGRHKSATSIEALSGLSVDACLR